MSLKKYLTNQNEKKKSDSLFDKICAISESTPPPDSSHLICLPIFNNILLLIYCKKKQMLCSQQDHILEKSSRFTSLVSMELHDFQRKAHWYR